MSHHSQEDQDRLLEDLTELRSLLGETGKFPDGKLTDHDEGEIVFAIGVKDNKVVMHFGKSVAWVGMTAEQARQLSNILDLRAGQAEKGMTVAVPEI